MNSLENVCLKLNEIGAIKFGDFTLKDGRKSPIYIDLRLLVTYPQVLQLIAKEMAIKVKPLSYNRICGIPYAALPIAVALSFELNQPMIYPRKEVKDYGTKKLIEGIYQKGETILVIDDLITSGASKLETIKPLENEGLKVTDIVVLVDREQGGSQAIEEKGYRVHAVVKIKEMLKILQTYKKISNEKYQEVMNYLTASK